MGRRNYSLYYSMKNFDGDVVKAKTSNVVVHFKNTVDTVKQMTGMNLARANRYLKNVIAHKECVPFKRFNGGIGKCAQAKQFSCIVGRWPEKSARVVLDLLKNAVANCEFLGRDPDDFVIAQIQVQQAPIRTRRTYRAHGRINPYERHLSHLQMILREKKL